VARLRHQAEVAAETAGLLNSIGEQRQESARRQVEELVTRALQVIFDKNLSFHMVQSVKANRTEVDFVIRSTYGAEVVETPVMDARGGGMAAVVGFVLRLVVLLLTPGARRFLALDESFAHVSASYEPRVAEFLREVADKAGVQLLLVTHSDAYSDLADARYRLSLGEDGCTRVEEGTEHG
jgi:ABC-type taurine transport system ATPase subunit